MSKAIIRIDVTDPEQVEYVEILSSGGIEIYDGKEVILDSHVSSVSSRIIIDGTKTNFARGLLEEI